MDQTQGHYIDPKLTKEFLTNVREVCGRQGIEVGSLNDEQLIENLSQSFSRDVGSNANHLTVEEWLRTAAGERATA